MKKFVLFLFLLCSVWVNAQVSVFSYGEKGQIVVNPSYIKPLQTLTKKEIAKATQLVHAMEVTTQSGDTYAIKAFKIENWEEGDFQYVEIYKDQKKIYKLSNRNNWIHFPIKHSGASSPQCCYVAHMGDDAIALVFHETIVERNLPNITIVVLKDNQATLVYNKECGINEFKSPKTEISFKEYIPDCLTMDKEPCMNTRNMYISKDGIQLSALPTLQDDLLYILKKMPFTPIPYNETKFTYHKQRYSIDNTSGQIPNRLYENIQCTQYILADENDLLPVANAKFRTNHNDICMVAVNFGGVTDYNTTVLITVNQKGEILDSLEVESGFGHTYIKQYRILGNLRVVVTSIKTNQKESIPFYGFGSFIGNRVDRTYRLEKGKFILEREQVFEEQTYTEKLLEKNNFNIWYDNILEHPEFSLQEAKDAFQKRKVKYQNANKYYTGIGLPAGEFEPEWDRAIASVNPTREHLLYYTVPIKSPYQYKAMLLNTHDLKSVNVHQKMLVIKNTQDNSITFYLLSLVPDVDFEKQHKNSVAENFVFLKEDNYFSGTSICSSVFSGLIIDSEKFINGRMVKRVFVPSLEEEIMERMASLISILQPYHFFRFTNGKGKSVELDWQQIRLMNTRKNK